MYKKLNYQQAKKKAADLTDKLGCPIDKNIKSLVISLWMCGINTDGSCEGHKNWGLPYPWVSIVRSSNAKALNVVMRARTKKNVWVFHPYGQGKYLRITPWDIKRPLPELHADAKKMARYLGRLSKYI